MDNTNFRKFSFEFESAEFSKKIYFLLPLVEDVAVRQMIWDSIIGWQYSGEMLELELQEEVSMYMERVADNPELVPFYVEQDMPNKDEQLPAYTMIMELSTHDLYFN